MVKSFHCRETLVAHLPSASFVSAAVCSGVSQCEESHEWELLPRLPAFAEGTCDGDIQGGWNPGFADIQTADWACFVLPGISAFPVFLSFQNKKVCCCSLTTLSNLLFLRPCVLPAWSLIKCWISSPLHFNQDLAHAFLLLNPLWGIPLSLVYYVSKYNRHLIFQVVCWFLRLRCLKPFESLKWISSSLNWFRQKNSELQDLIGTCKPGWKT